MTVASKYPPARTGRTVAGVVDSHGACEPYEVAVLSAVTLEALEALTDRLVARLRAPSPPELGDLAFTLQTAREAGEYRRITVGRTAGEVAAALATRDPARVFTRRQARRRRPVAFLFPGLGDQYVGMARALYEHEPAFRAALDECAARALPHLGLDLREVIHPPRGADDPTARGDEGGLDLRAMVRPRPTPAPTSPLGQARVAQPAVFAVAYAMAQCLREWGIEPVAAIGHSLGEYAAAAVAGVFSLADAVRIVCARADLIARLPPGAMLAVAGSAHDVMPLAGDDVDLAVVNGDRAIVLAGLPEAIARAEARLSAREISCRPIATTHASHSRMLAAAQHPLVELLRSVAPRAPAMRIVSNVSGTWLEPREAADPAYWARHMCSTVRFSDGLRCLLDDSDAVLLEVGPGLSLGSFARQHPSCGHDRVASILSTIPLVHVRESDLAFFRTTLGKLWLAGVEVDWRRGWAQRGGTPPVPLAAFLDL